MGTTTIYGAANLASNTHPRCENGAEMFAENATEVPELAVVELPSCLYSCHQADRIETSYIHSTNRQSSLELGRDPHSCSRHTSCICRRPHTELRGSRQLRLTPVGALDIREPTASVPKISDAIASNPVLDNPISTLEQSFKLNSGNAKREASPGEDLKSTWEHRYITAGTLTLLALLMGEGLSEIDSLSDLFGGVGALLFAYYLSDFLTGIYHWGVDNYGDADTPIVGSQIAAFQGHHQKPWTITQREFCNNIHKVFKPAAPFTFLCLLISPWTPAWLDVGLSTATFLTCMSQQFHAWAHMKTSQLPLVVRLMQESGVLVSRKAHGAHHKAPFEGNYCIVSGAWNPILDAGGEEGKSFFRRLENAVHARTGVEPRCWHEPDYSWQEE